MARIYLNSGNKNWSDPNSWTTSSGKLSYIRESLRRPYFWFGILCAAILLTLYQFKQEIDSFSYYFCFICCFLLFSVLIRQNNRSILKFKVKTGKKLTL